VKIGFSKILPAFSGSATTSQAKTQPMKKSLILGAMILLGSAASQLQAGTPAPKAPIAPAPVPPAAPIFTYDFLDVQYIYTDFDSPWIDDGHGVGANLSKSLGGPLYATGSFAWSDTIVDYEPVDFYGASAGLGVFCPIMDRLHVNMEGGALWSREDSDYYTNDDWGYFVGPGARFSVCQGFEVFANVYYTDFGSGEGNTDGFDVNVGAIFDIHQYFGIKVGALFGEDENSLFVGGRIYY
jgi:hypothetical protein